MKRSEALNIIREVVREAIEIDNTMTVLSVIDGKRNLDNDQIKQLFDDMPGTFYILRHEEGEQSDKRKVSRKEALKYVDYYNARLKRDSEKEEKLGAELKVLGFESELVFRIGEFNTDPSVFSINEGPGKDYLDKVAKDYYGEKDFESADPKPNPNDVAVYIGDTETDEIGEHTLADFIKKNNYKEVQVAEYQFDENKYDFSKAAGAGEYDSSVIIFKIVDKAGKHVLIPGDNTDKSYPYLATTDRGLLGDTYPLLEAEHVKIIKSIADIFQPSEVYENYADGKVNEQEMSQDDFNTIGNVLRDSTKAKQIHSLLLQMFPQQKELLGYNYKNDSYAEFKRFIFHIDKYKLVGPISINYTNLKLDPENMKARERKYQDYIDGKIDKYFRDTNSDPRKVDLSKMPPITVDETGEVMDGNHRAFLAIKQQKPLKGYKIVNANNTHPNVAKILQIVGREVKENFKDGKVKGKSRPGRVKKAGASCKGSVSDLRAKAKKYGGEKGKMYHWCANMKSGRKNESSK